MRELLWATRLLLSSSPTRQSMREPRGSTMRRLPAITLAVLLWIASLSHAADDSTKALNLFQRKVEQFRTFFSNPHTYVDVEDFPDLPTPRFTLSRIPTAEISFDVRRTDSLVSPLVGFVNTKFVVETNFGCGGDIADATSRGSWFSSADKAKAANQDSCFFPNFGGRVHDLNFNFAYQRNHWIFQGVSSNTRYSVDRPFLPALESPPWNALTKPVSAGSEPQPRPKPQAGPK